MKNNYKVVRPGKWELTCITYKLIGKPRPLEVIQGVLVKDKSEQKRVEKYLKELYVFESESDYQDFLRSFIVRNGTKGIKPNLPTRGEKNEERN